MRDEVWTAIFLTLIVALAHVIADSIFNIVEVLFK